MVAQNIVNQIVLSRTLHAAGRTPRILRPYLVIAAAALVLAAIELAFHPGVVIALLLSAAAALIVLRVTRDALQLASTFPEVARIPLVRRFLI